MSGVVLLVELPGGDVVAVSFKDRESAERWDAASPFESLGAPRIVTARSLSIGSRRQAALDAETRSGSGPV